MTAHTDTLQPGTVHAGPTAVGRDEREARIEAPVFYDTDEQIALFRTEWT